MTRAASRPHLAGIPADPRILRLVALADEELVHRVRGGSEEGVSVIWKNADMVEGLSDIPWHPDCGMGGHAVMCPLLIASVYLTESRPESGVELTGTDLRAALDAAMKGGRLQEQMPSMGCNIKWKA